MNANITHLRRIWQQAFGDSDDALDAFFSVGFSPDRYNCILEDGIPVSALYWFDCSLHGHKFAYLYAIATAKAHRGKGHFHRLMEDTHTILKSRGYSGTVLSPADEGLFHLYGRLGYRATATTDEIACQAADTPVALTQIDAREYEILRRDYLPKNGISQKDVTLDFYATYGRFYTGADFLLACARQDGVLYAQEILGNKKACPGILCALNAPKGIFRTPGSEKKFAMYYPLREDCPTPGYLGFDLD